MLETPESVESTGSNTDFKVAIGLSRKWDARTAGRGVARDMIEKLGDDPDFVLLFATVHYEKHGGFKEFLKGVWDVLPKGTPLIGGTVIGFINPQGCFTRGATAVGILNSEMDISIGVGRKTRRTPTSTGEKFAKTINDGLKSSKKKNRLLIEFMTGAKEPEIMTYEKIRNLLGKLPGRIGLLFRDILNEMAVRYFNQCQGMEDEILETFNPILNEYYIFGASTFDDLKALNNFQFYNQDVLDDAIVGLGVSLDEEIFVDRKLPLIPTGRKLKIKKGWKGYWIDEIDGRPAVTTYFEEMGWPKEYVKTHIDKMMVKTFLHPLGFEYKGVTRAFPTGFFFGESILTNVQIRKEEVELFLSSNKQIISHLDEYISLLSNKRQHFTFLTEIGPAIDMLGGSVKKIKEQLDDAPTISEYLFLFMAGEHTKKPGEDVIFGDYSLSILSI